MPTTRRRRIVRRAVMTLVLVVLLPVWYAGTMPVVCYATECFPAASPVHKVLGVVYRPLIYLTLHPESPGGQSFLDYYRWVRQRLHDTLNRR